ncbi:MAG TPA: DUF350 domain-containing protein [Streptosporangiaceae bacterium]|jgi:uncharacterized membrane protein YjfL (UPF0719 family)|nr:DUF350 domain-containing protein [Streptosporangiaceae bacterium]
MPFVLESGFGSALGHNTVAIAAYAGLGMVLFVVGFRVVDLATPGRLITVIRQERNPNATALATAGMVAIGLIVSFSIYASSGNLAEGLIATLAYGLVGIVVQTVAMLVFNLLIGVKVADLCAEPRLEPATVLLSVTYVMIGLVTGVSVI